MKQPRGPFSSSFLRIFFFFFSSFYSIFLVLNGFIKGKGGVGGWGKPNVNAKSVVLPPAFGSGGTFEKVDCLLCERILDGKQRSDPGFNGLAPVFFWFLI